MSKHTNPTVALLSGPVTEVIPASAVRGLVARDGAFKLLVDDGGRTRTFVLKVDDELKAAFAFDREPGEKDSPAAFPAHLFDRLRSGGTFEASEEHDLMVRKD